MEYKLPTVPAYHDPISPTDPENPESGEPSTSIPVIPAMVLLSHSGTHFQTAIQLHDKSLDEKLSGLTTPCVLEL